MESENWTIAAVLIAYNAALVGIGLWAQRSAKSEKGFLLAGEGLGPIVAGLAYAASTSSAWVLLGFTGFVAGVGLSALWMVPGILAGYAVVWLWAGPMLQRAARDGGAMTLIDVLSGQGTGATARAIKIAAAVIIAFCFTLYIAGQFDAAGQSLGVSLGVDPAVALIVGAAVIVAYTFLGGFLAVSLTDTLQGFAIVLVAVALPIGALSAVGGVEGLTAAIAAQPEAFTAPFGANAGFTALGFAVGLAATGFGALGQPHLLTWIMAARDRKARLLGAGVALGWGALVYAGMTVLALSARALAGAGTPLGETIPLDIARDLLPGLMPALVYAAIISAIMSTVDSQLFVASAAVSHDLRVSKRFPGREVLVTRVAIIVLAAAAVILSLTTPASVFDRVLSAWTTLGAAFGPTVVALALRWRPRPEAILAAIVAGFVMAVGANMAWPTPGSWSESVAPWIPALILLWLTRRRG